MSIDGGQTWQPGAVPLPRPASGGRCSSPVVAYDPNGRRVHAVYKVDRQLIVATSTEGGATWSAPAPIPPPPVDIWPCCIRPDPQEIDFEDYRLATPLDPADSGHLYLVSNVFAASVKLSFPLVFAQSSDGGATWSEWRAIAALSKLFTGSFMQFWERNEGMSIAAGHGGKVATVWDVNHINVYLPSSASTFIYAALSTNYGATFALDALIAFEQGIRYGVGGAPDARFWPNNRLHVVYARLVDRNDTNPTKIHHAIRYVHSTNGSYTHWSPPETLSSYDASDAIETRMLPMLALGPCGSDSLLHVAWLDGRRGGKLRDIWYLRKHLGRPLGSPAERVSDPTPPTVVTPEQPAGATSALAATDDDYAIAVWQDRRDGASPDTDVFSSRIFAGVSCP